METNYWLYQMRAYDDDGCGKGWRPEDFRNQVCEGVRVDWAWEFPMNIRPRRDQRNPAPGDIVVFFFCKTGLKGNRATRSKRRTPRWGEKPGIYGIGEVLEFFNNAEDGRLLGFMPKPPTDTLKTQPLWDADVRVLLSRVRGRWNQRTMWRISQTQFNELHDKMLALA